MALFAALSHLATAKSHAIYAGGCRFRADLQRFLADDSLRHGFGAQLIRFF
jgi:hypothetical protein